jgi:hypothetical protein
MLETKLPLRVATYIFYGYVGNKVKITSRNRLQASRSDSGKQADNLE